MSRKHSCLVIICCLWLLYKPSVSPSTMIPNSLEEGVCRNVLFRAEHSALSCSSLWSIIGIYINHVYYKKKLLHLSSDIVIRSWFNIVTILVDWCSRFFPRGLWSVYPQVLYPDGCQILALTCEVDLNSMKRWLVTSMTFCHYWISGHVLPG